MNLASLTALPVVQEPPAPPAPVHNDDARSRADDRDRKAEEAFDRALKQELERKQLQATPGPSALLPLFLPQSPVVAAEKDAISTVSGAGGVQSAFTASALNTARPERDWAAEAAEAAPARDDRPDDRDAAPIRLVVEPGLPPVQNFHGEDQKVSLVDFPQVVVGQVRTAMRGHVPVTQLDFHITPPHVGPVNLQVTYNQGVVGVQLTALTLQAKQALEGQVGTIQQILTAHNLTPGQVRVVTAVGGRAGANGAAMKGDQAGFNLFAGGRRRQPGGQDGTVKTT